MSVLRGSDRLLDERSRAVAAWARSVAGEPRSVTSADADALRAAGFDSAQILRLTLYVALRVAFAPVNGVLGARSEVAYLDRVDPEVRAAREAGFGQ